MSNKIRELAKNSNMTVENRMDQIKKLCAGMGSEAFVLSSMFMDDKKTTELMTKAMDEIKDDKVLNSPANTQKRLQLFEMVLKDEQFPLQTRLKIGKQIALSQGKSLTKSHMQEVIGIGNAKLRLENGISTREKKNIIIQEFNKALGNSLAITFGFSNAQLEAKLEVFMKENANEIQESIKKAIDNDRTQAQRFDNYISGQGEFSIQMGMNQDVSGPVQQMGK